MSGPIIRFRGRRMDCLDFAVILFCGRSQTWLKLGLADEEIAAITDCRRQLEDDRLNVRRILHKHDIILDFVEFLCRRVRYLRDGRLVPSVYETALKTTWRYREPRPRFEINGRQHSLQKCLGLTNTEYNLMRTYTDEGSTFTGVCRSMQVASSIWCSTLSAERRTAFWRILYSRGLLYEVAEGLIMPPRPVPDLEAFMTNKYGKKFPMRLLEYLDPAHPEPNWMMDASSV